MSAIPLVLCNLRVQLTRLSFCLWTWMAQIIPICTPISLVALDMAPRSRVEWPDVFSLPLSGLMWTSKLEMKTLSFNSRLARLNNDLIYEDLSPSTRMRLGTPAVVAATLIRTSQIQQHGSLASLTGQALCILGLPIKSQEQTKKLV